MMTTFHQFFRPTKAKMDEMLKKALICYDANVLLNIYRFFINSNGYSASNSFSFLSTSALTSKG
jgi:hypothetical protein